MAAPILNRVVANFKGILRHEWRKARVKGHAQDVLDTVKNC